jgi:hypothetical protein
MPDLGILEILIAFFLFVPLAQSYIKSFYFIDGFAWFPPIALFCAIGLFPAYGFRPEAVPLLALTVVYNMMHFKARKARIERSYFYFSLMLIFMALTTFIAVYFLPLTDTRTRSYTQSKAEHDSERNNEYFIQIYNNREGGDDALIGAMPLIIVVPPVIGSTLIIDRVCGELAARGAIVVGLTRVNLDVPAKNTEGKRLYPSIGAIKNYAVKIYMALKNKNTDSVMYLFEQERIDDIRFILPLIEKRFNTNGIYIFAYDEGASAAMELARNGAFIKDNPALKGIIAVGARQVQADRSPPIVPVLSLDSSGFIPPQAVVPEALSALPLVSEGRFVPLGSLIYTDIPEKYPLIAAIARGKNDDWENKDRISRTAALVYEFVTNVRIGSGE